MENKSKCLLVEPYELPKEIIIDNTLETKKNFRVKYRMCIFKK